MTRAERPPRSMAALLDEWHDGQVARQRWAAATVRRHRSNIERHLTPNLGDWHPTNVAIGDVEALDAKLAAEGLAPASRRSVHGTLRQALAHAVKAGHLGRNVAALAGGPSAPRPEVLVPTDGQVAVLLNLAERTPAKAAAGIDAPPTWVHPFLRLAAYTGARPGELAALRWADVDLDRGELLIRATAHADAAGKGYAVGETTKTGRARRIALDRDTVKVLAGWWPAGIEGHRVGWLLVFPGDASHVRPIPAHLPRRWFKRLAARADINPQCTLYSLRHWHATWLLRRGAAPTVVAERLGHANPTLTLNVYGRHVPAGDRGIADLIDRGDE